MLVPGTRPPNRVVDPNGGTLPQHRRVGVTKDLLSRPACLPDPELKTTMVHGRVSTSSQYRLRRNWDYRCRWLCSLNFTGQRLRARLAQRAFRTSGGRPSDTHRNGESMYPSHPLLSSPTSSLASFSILAHLDIRSLAGCATL